MCINQGLPCHSLTEGFILLQMADRGDYVCYASNSIATVRLYIKLKVFGERTMCGMRGVAEGERRRRIAGGDTANSTHWPWQVGA